MKLLLCSEGFHTPNTIQACVELCNKPQDKISVAIVNEGFSVEDGDKRWVLDNLNSVSTNFPAGLDIINLLALSIDEVEERLHDKDVIFMVGGNADFLMTVIVKTGFDKLLPKLLETKVYVGSSAGSRVMGRKLLDPEFNKIFGNEDQYSVEEYMGLVDFTTIPHINSEHFPERTPEALRITTEGAPFTVYGLQDDSAIVVDGEELRFIGTEPLVVGCLLGSS